MYQFKIAKEQSWNGGFILKLKFLIPGKWKLESKFLVHGKNN